ncbi:MAG: heavy-metal-associated domain-containing protein [Bacteriovoracaceae bacterium]
MKKNLKMTINGMSCNSCVNSIEKVLKKKDGIINATVNLSSSSALIEFEDTLLNPNQIAEVITEAGFEAKLD